MEWNELTVWSSSSAEPPKWFGGWSTWHKRKCWENSALVQPWEDKAEKKTGVYIYMLHVGMTHVGMESDSSLRCMVLWQRAKGIPWNILNFLERLWNLYLRRHSKVGNRGLSIAAWWDLLWALCWTTWLPEVPSYLNYNSVQLSNKKHRHTNGSGEGNHNLVKGNTRESKNVWLGRWEIQTHYQRWCRTRKFTYNATFKFTETKEE